MKRKKSYLNAFVIPFSGLSIGMHKYEFEIDNEFFEYFPIEGIQAASIHCEVQFEKRSNFMALQFNLSGTVNCECFRCLEDCELPINYQDELFVKFGSSENNDDESLLIISETAHQIDVSELLYQYCLLALPIKRAHSNNDCNPELSKYLIGQMPETEEDSEEIKTDPRWDILKKLKDK
jgi:uncharacterized protein